MVTGHSAWVTSQAVQPPTGPVPWRNDVDAVVERQPQRAAAHAPRPGAGRVVHRVDAEVRDDTADPGDPAARARPHHGMRVVDLAQLRAPGRPQRGPGVARPDLVGCGGAGDRLAQASGEVHPPVSPRFGDRRRLGTGRRTLSRVHGDTGRVSAVPEDFDEFVTARWRELYAVATVTTGDPGSGARATASALASLGRRWTRTTDDGAPTAASRAAVLTAALAAADLRSPAHPPTPRDPPGEPGDLGTDDDLSRSALAAVLAEAPPTARASLAAQHWWDEGPALVAAGAHADGAVVAADLAALHAGLAAAHAAVLGRDEHGLAWALPTAVADLLEHQVDAAPVADPVALVDVARARSTRRHRARLAGVGAGLALVVAAAALAWPALAGSGPQAPAPASGAWASVTSWSPRGPLVGDPTVASIADGAQAADPTARLLYAGPVGDTIAVVMTGATPADPMLSDGVPGPAMGEGYDGGQAFLRLWTAPTRLGTAALGPAAIDGDPTARTRDLVALNVVQDAPATAPAVLVMTRPVVADVFVTTGLLPQPDGSLVPEVLVLPLVDGVASHTSTSDVFTPQDRRRGLLGASGRGRARPPRPALERARRRAGRRTAHAPRRCHRTCRRHPRDHLGARGGGAARHPRPRRGRHRLRTPAGHRGHHLHPGRRTGAHQPAGRPGLRGSLDPARAPGRGAVHRPARPAAPPDPHPPGLRRGRPRRRHRPAPHPATGGCATASPCARGSPPCRPPTTRRAPRSACASWLPTATWSTTPSRPRPTSCSTDLVASSKDLVPDSTRG